MASNYTVRDIFGTGHVKEQSVAQTPKDDGKEDRTSQKTLWPTHKEDDIDRICKEYGQGIGYAKWQNHKYESTVSFPDWVHSTVTKGSDIPKIDNKKWFNRSYKLVDPDLNYNRTRMSQD